MTIDIHTPCEGLEEKVIHHAKQAMIRLVHQYKTINRLACVMREDLLINLPENKVCEIKLSVYGENLFTHSRSGKYKLAVNEAIEHMKSQLELLASRQHDLPDKVTTTVRV
jgi:putative sigma-54 modulation protein